MIHNQMSHNQAKNWVLSLIYRAAIDFKKFKKNLKTLNFTNRTDQINISSEILVFMQINWVWVILYDSHPNIELTLSLYETNNNPNFELPFQNLIWNDPDPYQKVTSIRNDLPPKVNFRQKSHRNIFVKMTPLVMNHQISHSEVKNFL